MPDNDSVGIIENPEYSSISTSSISDTESDDVQDCALLIPAQVDEAEKTIETMHTKWSQTDLIYAVSMLPQGGISLEEALYYSAEARQVKILEQMSPLSQDKENYSYEYDTFNFPLAPT